MTDHGAPPPRRPAAFRLDDSKVRLTDDLADLPGPDEAVITQEDLFNDAPLQRGPESPRKTGGSFGKWLLIGLGGLLTLSIGLAIDSLIRDLYARADWLGWLGVALAALSAVALTGLAIRELAGLRRLDRIDGLRTRLLQAAEADNAKAATAGLKDLLALYHERPETAQGRAALARHMREVIDGSDLVKLAERDLLAPLDSQARRIVMNSAKRVSLVTAVSPRALVDVAMVLFENLRIIRRLSALYGGRPGTLGFIRLARHIIVHLGVTGGLTAGESLVHDVLGHGLATRLSARLGEGVINGLLTARIGIAAIAVCRPAPFVASSGPKISEFIGELASSGKEADNRPDSS